MEKDTNYLIAFYTLMLLLLVVIVMLWKVNGKLIDIRTITSEARDAQNCATWPNDDACK